MTDLQLIALGTLAVLAIYTTAAGIWHLAYLFLAARRHASTGPTDEQWERVAQHARDYLEESETREPVPFRPEYQIAEQPVEEKPWVWERAR